jgi:probable 2-oxoglutarate dehydrogenase E1 component DHKTD1
MYEKIAARKSVPQLYEEKLVVSCIYSPLRVALTFGAPKAERVLSPKDISDSRNSYKSYLEAQLTEASTYIPTISRLEEQWKGIIWSTDDSANHSPQTGVQSVLEKIGKASVAILEDFVRV